MNLIAKKLISSLTLIVVLYGASAAFAGAKRTDLSQEPEISINITKLPENPRLYSLVISDTDEHVISGNFPMERLQVLRAIMTEAEKFAATNEAVGTKEPLTTRFSDAQEPAFICDVQKTGVESTFFLTFTTEGGTLTLNTGKYFRSTRREQGVFFDLLTRLEAILPKLPAQAVK